MKDWNLYYCGLCEVDFAVKKESDEGESSCPKCESGEEVVRLEESTKEQMLASLASIRTDSDIPDEFISLGKIGDVYPELPSEVLECYRTWIFESKKNGLRIATHYEGNTCHTFICEGIPAELIKHLPYFHLGLQPGDREGMLKEIAKYELVECEECGGGGFSKAGTGYDAVCDSCGGLGKHSM